MEYHYNIEFWTDYQLDNANYPHDPEFMSSGLNPGNFDGNNGLYGGLFSGGRYSFEIIPEPVLYSRTEKAYMEVGPVSPIQHEVPDASTSVALLMIALGSVFLSFMVARLIGGFLKTSEAEAEEMFRKHREKNQERKQPFV